MGGCTALITAVAITVCGASACATHPSANATRVVDVVAVNADGHPVNGYHETISSTVTLVQCTLPSPAAVAADVYTCSPSAAGADACWPVPGADLLCLTDPWSQQLHRVHAGAPLPAVHPPALPEPLAVLLDDGSQCRLRNGGSWGSRGDGYTGAYWCGAGRPVVLTQPGGADVINRSTPVWTVKVGKLGMPGESLPPPGTARMVTAWFAAARADINP